MLRAHDVARATMALFRFVQVWWRQRWHGRDTVQHVAFGTVWLAADQLFRLVVAFLVGAWVARHLGTERFGLLNMATAFCAPFAALLSLGINQLVVRDLIRTPADAGSVLGTAAGLKLITGGLSLALCLVALALSPGAGGQMLLLVPVVMAGTLFQAGEVFDLWFQARQALRPAAVVRSAASLLVNGARIALIAHDAPLVWFAAASTAELAVCTAGWWWLYRRGTEAPRWSFVRSRAWSLLREAWPLALAGIAVQIQAYYDQVLLGWLGGSAATGSYAAALRLVLVFGFLPVALQTAAAPEIMRAWAVDRSLYLRRLRDLYRVMIVASLGVAVALALLAKPAVNVVYGTQFAATAVLLPWMSLRILLTSVGVARSIFVTNEALFIHSFVTAAAGAALNVALNLWWIPRWGAMGCVFAAMASFACTTLVFDLFHPAARVNLRVLLSALGLARLPT